MLPVRSPSAGERQSRATVRQRNAQPSRLASQIVFWRRSTQKAEGLEGIGRLMKPHHRRWRQQTCHRGTQQLRVMDTLRRAGLPQRIHAQAHRQECLLQELWLVPLLIRSQCLTCHHEQRGGISSTSIDCQHSLVEIPEAANMTPEAANTTEVSLLQPLHHLWARCQNMRVRKQIMPFVAF